MKFRFIPYYPAVDIEADSFEEAIAKFNAMHDSRDVEADETGSVVLNDGLSYYGIGNIEEVK